MKIKFYISKKEIENYLKIAEEKLPGISELFKNMYGVISVGNRKEIFFITKEMLKIYNTLIQNRNPYALGIYFGEYSDSNLKLSLQVADIYAKNFKRKYVRIEPGFEQKYLHGRNVQVRRIVEFDKKIRKGSLVIVTTTLGESLGFGRALIDFKNFEKYEKTETVIKNLIDLGWYLRKKKSYNC